MHAPFVWPASKPARDDRPVSVRGNNNDKGALLIIALVMAPVIAAAAVLTYFAG